MPDFLDRIRTFLISTVLQLKFMINNKFVEYRCYMDVGSSSNSNFI